MFARRVFTPRLAAHVRYATGTPGPSSSSSSSSSAGAPSGWPLIASFMGATAFVGYAFSQITAAKAAANPASGGSLDGHSKQPLHPKAVAVMDAVKPGDNDTKPRVFFDVAVDGKPAGRIVFALAWEEAPATATNFFELATKNPQGLSYMGSPFHRVIPSFMVQGGDITRGNGTGGRSIYGRAFPDETFVRRHAKPGLLSMANSGPHTNSSQFFITLVPTPHLDGRHVVFGEVVQGMDVVKAIEAVGSASGRTSKPVVVSRCGQLPAEPGKTVSRLQ